MSRRILEEPKGPGFGWGQKPSAKYELCMVLDGDTIGTLQRLYSSLNGIITDWGPLILWGQVIPRIPKVRMVVRCLGGDRNPSFLVGRSLPSRGRNHMKTYFGEGENMAPKPI